MCGMRVVLILLVFFGSQNDYVRPERTTPHPSTGRPIPGFGELAKHLVKCRGYDTPEKISSASENYEGQVMRDRVPSIDGTNEISRETTPYLCEAGPSSASEPIPVRQTISPGDCRRQSPLKNWPSEKRFPCELCGRSFKFYCSLEKHVETHKCVSQFPCELCDMKYKSETGLIGHMLRKHSNGEPFLCERCGKLFKLEKDLTSHLKIHSKKSFHLCEICGKRLQTMAGFRCHARAHAGEKPFSCELCGNSFGSSSILSRHMIKHTTGKPFACESCGSRYKNIGSLRYHTKFTLNCAKISCDFCNKYFRTHGALLKHIAEHRQNALMQEPVAGPSRGYLRQEDLSHQLTRIHLESTDNCNLIDPRTVQQMIDQEIRKIIEQNAQERSHGVIANPDTSGLDYMEIFGMAPSTEGQFCEIQWNELQDNDDRTREE